MDRVLGKQLIADVADIRDAEIWCSLVRYLRWQNHPDPEDGAQESIVRALSKLDNEEAIRQAAENPHRYFFGFAHFVAREGWRPRRAESLDALLPKLEAPAGREDADGRILIDQLLSRLEPEDRTLFLRYHNEDRSALSREMGLPIGTLRVNVHRICERLRRFAARPHREVKTTRPGAG